MSNFVGEPNPHREIDDVEKQLFVAEIEGFEPLTTVQVPDSHELMRLPHHDKVASSDIDIWKTASFMLDDGRQVTIGIQEVMSAQATGDDELTEDDRYSYKAWSITVESAPLVANGIKTVVEDYCRVEYVFDGEDEHWGADFDRFTASVLTDGSPTSSGRTAAEVNETAIPADPPPLTTEQKVIAQRLLAEEMESSNSEQILSSRFTLQRYGLVMAVLGRLSLDDLLIEVEVSE